MPTSAYFKFNQFVEDLCKKVHDLNGDTLKVYLSAAVPSASADLIKTDLAEIAAGAGYTAGGNDIQNTVTETGGVATVNAVDTSYVASGGTIPTFQYFVLFNENPSAPLDPLIGYWDYGSAVPPLADGESMALDFSGNKVLDIA